MSQTLSLSLRPASLDSFIGNTSVTASIKKQLAERVPAAILLSGQPGTGKTTLARIIASLVNPGVEDLDVENINGASDNGIDRIRELITGAAYCPFSGQKKVVVIDEAHQLTGAAQQALLIPTETDNTSTLWVFTSSNPDKLDKALRSRCVHYALKPMGEAETRALVQRAVENTGSEYDSTTFVAHMVKSRIGSPREILMAWERYSSGTPLAQCVSASEHNAEYMEIASAIISGDWNKTRTLLQPIQVADAKALRTIVAGRLRQSLLQMEAGAKAAAVATCVVGLGNANFEEGIAYSTAVGLFYKTTMAIAGAK